MEDTKELASSEYARFIIQSVEELACCHTGSPRVGGRRIYKDVPMDPQWGLVTLTITDGKKARREDGLLRLGTTAKFAFANVGGVPWGEAYVQVHGELADATVVSNDVRQVGDNALLLLENLFFPQ